ncbi:MAG TPA: hypothetical protein VM737_03170 [Gemmatimonadota bacterium]|nr:hypothetical protein [Gemmatimonadota bacterium]
MRDRRPVLPLLFGLVAAGLACPLTSGPLLAQTVPDPGVAVARVSVGGFGAREFVVVCLDGSHTFENGAPIDFDRRRFGPEGAPEPVSLENLMLVGEREGVPLYVSAYASPPYTELWLPVCRPADHFQLYLRIAD